MSFLRSRDHHLRRVSLEKARPREDARAGAPVPQGQEKLTVAAAGGVLALLLLGSGALEGVRAWCALLALVSLALAGILRYVVDFRRGVLRSLPCVIGLSVALLAPLAGVAVWESVAGPIDLRWLPLAFGALLMALVWGRAVALEGTVVAGALLLGYLALRERLDVAALGGLTVSVAGAVAAALVSGAVKRRSALVRIGLVIGCVQAATAASVLLLDPSIEPGVSELVALARIALAGVAVGLLVSGLLPAIEALFGVTTDVSLLELGNTNEAPLLRKLLLEASGTFHHSYIVGLLAEAAAKAIGANPLLSRVGALYHDVGKLNKPEYFAENAPDARERHAALSPEMSMLILSAHTRDGVELGRYYGLPQGILDFMVEHHGTTCIEYFYQRAVEVRGADSVSEDAFRYSGPKPRTRESAIVMVADAAEAISRQMPEPTLTRLRDMVHSVAMKRLLDGQFSECGLTLAELSRVEEACVGVLGAIYRSRPTYPKGKPHPLDLSQAPTTEPGREPVPGRPVGARGSALAGGPWASA